MAIEGTATGPLYFNFQAILAVDVDSTLVSFNKKPGSVEMELERNGQILKVYSNPAVVRAMRQFYFRGHGVIVHSAGKPQWAKYVVEKLGICDCVHAIMGKFDWAIDDQPANEWGPKVFYMHPNGDVEPPSKETAHG